MKVLGTVARFGVFAFVLILLREVMEHPMWDVPAAGAPTTLDFSVSILDDWALVTVVLGILLSMAMIGASYLVRDERLVNLLARAVAEEKRHGRHLLTGGVVAPRLVALELGGRHPVVRVGGGIVAEDERAVGE